MIMLWIQCWVVAEFLNLAQWIMSNCLSDFRIVVTKVSSRTIWYDVLRSITTKIWNLRITNQGSVTIRHMISLMRVNFVVRNSNLVRWTDYLIDMDDHDWISNSWISLVHFYFYKPVYFSFVFMFNPISTKKPDSSSALTVQRDKVNGPRKRGCKNWTVSYQTRHAFTWWEFHQSQRHYKRYRTTLWALLTNVDGRFSQSLVVKFKKPPFWVIKWPGHIGCPIESSTVQSGGPWIPALSWKFWVHVISRGGSLR